MANNKKQFSLLFLKALIKYEIPLKGNNLVIERSKVIIYTMLLSHSWWSVRLAEIFCNFLAKHLTH